MKAKILVILFAIIFINQMFAQDAPFKKRDHAIVLPSSVSATKLTTTKNSEQFAFQMESILTPILEDFQVNENPIFYKKYSPAIGIDSYEGFVVV